MAEISISLNGRIYDIACDAGQEGRVSTLASYIDQRVQQIAKSGGAYNDAHLLVLTALVLADELFEAQESQHASKVARNAASTPVSNKEDEQAMVNVLNHLTKRIEGIAERVAAA